ncbi:MAG: hypothetical protein LBN29_12690 [Mediterranea sp.]|jgi:hypothetical protein|nr:hypothetical protein [Mediterranea sp.]
MVHISVRSLRVCGLLYLLVPVLIFVVGWSRGYVAVPLSLLMLYASGKAISSRSGDEGATISVPARQLALILGVLSLWVVLSGIGRYVWQNDDHYWRNAVFNDLILRDWPVSDGTHTLCYYFGFWLPAALVGKLFGSVAAANFALLVWSVLGMSLFYFLICAWLRSVKTGILLLLIFFSGIDLFGYLDFYLARHRVAELWPHLLTFPHIEWSTIPFQASSVTTLLFWVFNQSIPFFIGMMLLLPRGGWRYKPFVYSLLLLFSPFPFVGFAPAMLCQAIREARGEGLPAFIRQSLTVENLAAIGVVSLVGLFYLSNIAAGESGFRPPRAAYLFYLLTQYVVFFPFVLKDNYKDPLLWTLFATCLVFSLVNLGESTDFCMRTNIPFTLYLMLLVMKRLYVSGIGRRMKRLLVVVLVLGAVTPFFEIARTVRQTCHCVREREVCERRLTDRDSIFDEKLTGPNFLGRDDSLFNQYLLRR